MDSDANPKLLVDCESFVMTKIQTKKHKSEHVKDVITRDAIEDATVVLAYLTGLPNPESYKTHSCTILQMSNT